MLHYGRICPSLNGADVGLENSSGALYFKLSVYPLLPLPNAQHCELASDRRICAVTDAHACGGASGGKYCTVAETFPM
jgi:hypothetical protein